MGSLQTRVTLIQRRTFLGFPVKTLHKYRETYYGEIKNCEDYFYSFKGFAIKPKKAKAL